MSAVSDKADAFVIGKTGSQLAPALLQAYLETHYRVRDAAGDLLLRIGEPNEALLAVHRRHGVTSSAFVTAWNPCGRAVEPSQNAKAHAELVRVVRSRGWQAVDGTGQHPGNDWPGEESLLVPGPTLDQARTLGEQFWQNAIVWAGEDAIPWLLLLR